MIKYTQTTKAEATKIATASGEIDTTVPKVLNETNLQIALQYEEMMAKIAALSKKFDEVIEMDVNDILKSIDNSFTLENKLTKTWED